MAVTSEQVGGTHYLKMKEQPIKLITDTKCTFIQGCVIKYVSRFRDKNGQEDLEKAIQCCMLGIEFNDGMRVIGMWRYSILPKSQIAANVERAVEYTIKNNMSMLQGRIMMSVMQFDYSATIELLKQLIDTEYGQNVKNY